MKTQSLMKRLIHTYAFVLIAVIIVFSVILSYVTMLRNQAHIEEQTLKIGQNIDTVMRNQESDLRQLVLDLFPTQTKVQSMLDYFYLDFPLYYRQQLSQSTFSFFPRDIQQLYDRYDDAEGFLINLEATHDSYLSTREHKMGSKSEQLPDISQYLTFHRSITSYDTTKPLGTLYLLLDYKTLDAIIERENNSVNPVVFVLSEHGAIEYQYQTTSSEALRQRLEARFLSKEAFTKTDFKGYDIRTIAMVNGSTLLVGNREVDVLLVSFKMMLPILLGGSVLIAILLLLLFKMFGRYDRQIHDIVHSLAMIRTQDVKHRITLDNKEDELFIISREMNDALDSSNIVMNQVFQMEHHQQEINLRALQSQINPHFLYNTLEFIRMYAVSEGVDELAEIVYTFSMLLRNNISLAKTTTLAKELDFLEKYVYLYQIRYPNRIAYKIDVAADFTKIVIPKFTLQPMIENYFIHGIDFKRIDNAIRVQAYKEHERIMIQVLDNGRGIDPEKLAVLQKRIADSTFDVNRSNSVGLINVHERLKVLFKDKDYRMEVGNNELGGFVITISFREDEVDV